MSNKFHKTKVGKTASVLVSVTTAVWLSGAAILMPTVAAGQTVEDLNAQIQTLLSQITALQSQLAALQGGATGGAVCGYTFGADLKMGSVGTDVMNLQKALNSDSATQLAATGSGSPGNETTYFGSITKAAAIKFQNKYASEVLTPVGLAAGTGYVGSMTRAKLNALYGTCAPVSPTPTPTGTVTPLPGTGISVSSAAQPTASLAVNGAARVPFTKINLTASSDGDVTVDTITIERTGLAHDAVFSSVVLLDETGNQIGLVRTLNSSHQAKIGEAFVVKAGQTRTLTIAGNMASSLTSYAGEVAYLSAVSVNTSAAVSGALPITGAGHTINATLAIGSVTAARGPLDPNTNVSKSIGTTGYTFSSLKITASSAEKIRLHSVRWNQASSASDSDLANIKVVVDSASYDVTLSSDGKYYTAKFGDGIVIDKGMSSEISIKADIVGGSGRTIAFSIEKTTDIYLKGETYGYGITPPTTGTGITSGNIWFAGSTVTVSQGTITVNQDTSVASQNIALNMANQPLAGITVKVEGEDVTVGQIIFDLATTTGSWTGLLTNVSLYDQNGAVVAGPVDEASTAAGSSALTFTDSVTFPIGTHTYTVKGKTPTTVANNGTYQLKTDPATDWTSVTGGTTGNTITPSPSGLQSLQIMTVKAASVEISTSATPAAQNVVKGSQAFAFANIVFDATGSGEDLKFVSVPLNYSTDDTATLVTSCSLFDGATALNTGSNAVSPSAAASSTTFTFDTPLIVAKGTAKTLAVKCNLSASATADKAYYWSYATGATATGVTSGQSATVTDPTADTTSQRGNKMTVVNSGTFTVVLDPSSPGYALATGGSTGNTISVIKFTAVDEAINLDRVHLQLTNTSSSSASDITQLTLWDGATQVGTALFTGTNTTATATISNFQIPKDESKKMTVKSDFAQIGTGKPVTVGGHFIAIDYDNDELTGTHGTGAQSGASTDVTTSADTASAGVRLFRSIPTVTKVALSTSESTLANGSSVTLLKWKVSADAAGDVGVGKFTLTFATTTAVLDTIDVFAYSDSACNIPVTGLYSGSGDFSPTDIDMEENWADSTTQFDFTATNSSSASTTVQVPAGGSIWFVAKGTVTGTASGASITTTLQGDSAFPTAAFTNNLLYAANAAQIDDNDTHDDFLWSGNSTQTPAAITDGDWTNGYGVMTTDSVYDTISK